MRVRKYVFCLNGPLVGEKKLFAAKQKLEIE